MAAHLQAARLNQAGNGDAAWMQPPEPAAHGYFESYGDLSRLTRAAPLAAGGRRTPVFVRFQGCSADGAARSFDVKFYTDHGEWDLTGDEVPVQGPYPDSAGEDAARALRLTSEDGTATVARLVWQPAGEDARRAPDGLPQAIADGRYPAWELGLEVLAGAQTAGSDSTRLSSKPSCALISVGRLVLDMVVDRIHIAVAAVPFDARRTIPGVEPAGIDTLGAGTPGAVQPAGQDS